MSEAWIQWEGHVVDNEFHLKKYLGGSDQSAVFLAESRGQEPQQAAVKLMPADPAKAARQLSQWGLAQRLSHPHLIRLLRKGRCRLGASDFIFVVMEYAEENLSQIVPERPLTIQEVREMLAPTLDALAYLHSQGFVHGHLKPAVIMAIQDQVKLASDTLCAAGETVTDPEKLTAYDPPEKASGVRAPAGDIWSLGMILTEALTQRLPTWGQADGADPVLPANLPAPFLDIVRGCLRRDPGDRWTGAGITARLHSTPPSPEPQPQSRPRSEDQRASATESILRQLALPVVIAVLAVVALVAGLGQWRQRPAPRPEVSAVKPEPEPGSQGTDSPSPQAGDRQPALGARPGVVLDKPMPGIRPRPTSLRSETAAPQINSGLEASGVVHQVLPDVPQTASDTIQGTIKVSVRVNVDPPGNVLEAELETPGPSRYFARLALAAAQNWKFAAQNQDAARAFLVHFAFRNSGTTAFATRAAP